MDAPNNYILVINGKPEGPYTISQLRDLKIKPGDFVKTDGMDDYKEANEVAELRQLFGFKKETFLQYYGSFDQRLLASAVDWFLTSTACAILACLVVVFVNDKMVRIAIAFSLLMVIPIVKFIYQVVMESSAKQGTYGKQLLKIRVGDLEGNRISPAHAAGRNFAKIFSILTFFTGYLYAFFNKQQQCLHDVIAGTVIVKDRLI